MSAKGLRYFSVIINLRLIKFVEYWHQRSIKGPTSHLFGLVNPHLPGRWLVTGRLEGGWFSVWCPLTAVSDCVLLTYSIREFCPSLDVMGEWCIYFLLIWCMYTELFMHDCSSFNSSHIFTAALRSRCGHYIFVLWFLLLSSFFSLPNLSSRRVHVYHTSTHGVALVRI